MTPSTILSARSTSPPKSLWPGVSTMLILTVVIADAGGLGENGDAALALEVVRVHDALGDGFIGAEDAALLEHGVDQGGLAVVDVSDDCDVANRFVFHLFQVNDFDRIQPGGDPRRIQPGCHGGQPDQRQCARE